MKTKILILSFCLAFSLACLSTSAAVNTIATVTPDQVEALPIADDVVFVLPTVESGTVESVRCARVVAQTALHLRSAADVHASSITHLVAGDLVQVIDDSDLDWWRVQVGEVEGFARSIYLQELECVK